MMSSGLGRMAWTSLALAVVLVGACAAGLRAQETETPAAEAPAAETTTAEAAAPGAEQVAAMGLPLDKVPAELQSNFQQMVHFYRIARFDLATNMAQLVRNANPDPTVLLMLVEHKDVGYAMLAEMAASENPELSEAAKALKKVAEEGIYIKRKDGDRILNALKALTKNERAYQLSLMELKYSGEYVAPYALGLLGDKAQAPELHAAIKRALLEIDRPVVYPLVVAMETPDEALKLMVVELLHRLGYKMALPGLKALAESGASSEAVKTAAARAIETIGGKATLDAAASKLYYDLAESLYYDRLTVVADAKRPTTDAWGWIPGSGLAYREAPTAVVNEIMAARACECGLRADPDALELVALWMSVEMQMNAELGQVGGGAKNPWAPATMPTTEFFGRAIGQRYLLEVLDRALRDQNVLVALQAIKALERVGKESYLAAGEGKRGSPLVGALEYPDRMIRFGAAFAIVAIEPHGPFYGANRVVPVLAEAVNLESGSGVLIIDANQDNLNRLQGEFRQLGWKVVGATNGNDGVSKARGMARIDAVLLGTNVENVDYVEVIQLLRSDFATAMVPIVLLSGDAERVKFSFLKENQKYIDQVPAAAPAAAVLEKVQSLSAEAGAVALDPAVSKQVSLRAALALNFIATANLSFTALPARPSLLSAAEGKNEELAIATMQVLAQMPDDEIQQRLADVALAAGAGKAIQVAALESIAQTARHIGNKLQSASVTALMKRVATETDNDIRDAVGTVLGALDLEPKLPSQLIREHATETEGAK